jgi:zinc protease
MTMTDRAEIRAKRRERSGGLASGASWLKRLVCATAAVAVAFSPMAPLTTAALAAANGSGASAQGSGVVVPPLGFQRRELANGLEVYTLRDTSTSNVSVQVWYRVGSKDDPQGRSGFAHLFEHLMFKSTRNLPPETFDRLTEDVGGSNNAFTASDMTAYFESVPANHLERMLFAEAERMGSLVVDEEAFVTERDVVKEEYRQRILASPYGRLFGLFVPQTVFSEHPYRRSGIGSIEDLEASTLEDVRRFHETYYRPDNAILIVAGNFDQAQLDRWIDHYFAPIERPDRPIPVHNVEEPVTGPREATFHAPNVPLPAVVLAWPTVPYGHPDRAALDVLDGILSTGESSRLYRSLVYDTQLAAATSSSATFNQQAGYLSAYAIMAGGRTPEEGIAAIASEVERFSTQPVTAAELDEAKNELIAALLRQRETVEQRAMALGTALIMTGEARTADLDPAAIQAVTVADVQRVARQYLRADRTITIRYLAASEGNPVSVQPVNVPAPITVADLAPEGPLVTLLPEGERTPLPQPGPAPEALTPSISERRLANGMRVLVAPTRNVPLVSARLSFSAGTRDDPEGREGTAGLMASLLTQGTDTMSAPEIAASVEQLGASLGAGSGADFVNVFASAPASVFDRAAGLMADVVRNASFAEAELERQRAQVLDGLRVSLTQPGNVASLAAARAVFGDAPYGRPGNGTINSVTRITRDDVAGFHSAHVQPSRATLVFSGDIEPEQAFALAERLFGDWRDAPGARAAVSDAAGAPVAPRVIVIDQPGAGQAAVVVAMRGVTRDDADYYPLLLGNALMGGGFSARLNQEIRINRGLSYGARSSLSVYRQGGTLMASTQTRNDAAAEVAGLMLAEIERLSTSLPTEDELAPRRATLIGSMSRSLETVNGLGAVVSTYALNDRPMSEIATYGASVNAVTPAQIRDAAMRRLPASGASLVIVGDASQFIDELRRLYPDVEVIALSDLDLDSARLRE